MIEKLIGLSLSATILFGFGLISHLWTQNEHNLVPRSTDTSFCNQSKEGYIVWGPNCKIRDIKPFDESIVPFIKTYKLENCSDKPLLTSIVRNEDSHTLVLHNEYKHYYTDDPDASWNVVIPLLEGQSPGLSNA